MDFISRMLFVLVLTFLSTSLTVLSTEESPPSSSNPNLQSSFPWKKNIVTTTFWIGQGRTSYSAANNVKSAWDEEWKENYGGFDDPDRRIGFAPSKFAPTLNPFYIALPFNDIKYPDLAKKFVPWYKTPAPSERYISQCKGRWIQIKTKSGKVCYGQWEDVGPIRYDMAGYVFGNERPREFNKAGLDVSPAISNYLGLSGLNQTDWRFVEASEVPLGPWLKYGEQAILFSAIKKQEESLVKKMASESSAGAKRRSPSDRIN